MIRYFVSGRIPGGMVTIRSYREADDARAVGRLIADTFARYNLADLPPADRDACLGPFRYATSDDPVHRRAIAEAIRDEIVLVAEDGGDLVGVLRGRSTRLASLFVRGDRHRQGIGRELVKRFEAWVTDQGFRRIRVAASPFAVPFYQSLGYRCTTSLRRMPLYDSAGYIYQPMQKMLGQGRDTSR